MKKTGWIFILLGLPFLAGSFLAFQHEQQFLARAEEVTGVVTDYTTHTDNDNGNTYCPIFTFTGSDGKTINHESDLCTSGGANKNGEEVKLYYDPASGKVQQQGFLREYIGVILISCLGLPFLLFGLAFALRKKPKQTK